MLVGGGGKLLLFCGDTDEVDAFVWFFSKDANPRSGDGERCLARFLSLSSLRCDILL